MSSGSASKALCFGGAAQPRSPAGSPCAAAPRIGAAFLRTKHREISPRSRTPLGFLEGLSFAASPAVFLQHSCPSPALLLPGGRGGTRGSRCLRTQHRRPWGGPMVSVHRSPPQQLTPVWFAVALGSFSTPFRFPLWQRGEEEKEEFLSSHFPPPPQIVTDSGQVAKE